ncbi:hypothetical protein TSMEX_001228 [Taenia solium]|eukprot:TsM_000704700 transcript=TsM_000704700 gene=TsM_000704700
MVFRLCLAALVTAALAEACVAPERDLELMQYFGWRQVSQTSFRLQWDKHMLAERHVDRIAVTATPIPKFGRDMFEIAPVAAGQLILTKLLPEMGYELITQVFKGQVRALTFTANVETVLSSKFKLPHIHCISLHAFRAESVG